MPAISAAKLPPPPPPSQVINDQPISNNMAYIFGGLVIIYPLSIKEKPERVQWNSLKQTVVAFEY